MNIKRIKELQKLLEKNPLDPFLLYAMTLEFLGKNNKYYFSKSSVGILKINLIIHHFY